MKRACRSRAWRLVMGWADVLCLLGRDEDSVIVARERAVDLVDFHFSKVKRLTFSPSLLAAAALYVACLENGVRVTQRLIGLLAGRSEKCVRDSYKKLREELGLHDDFGGISYDATS